MNEINTHPKINPRCAWAGGTYAMFPDFCENLTIHVRDSTKPVGLVPFSATYLICRHVRTDGGNDELIWVGLGDLQFLQVKTSYIIFLCLS